MGDLAEDRVYDDHTDDDTAYLATATGVAAVAVANGRVGRFSLARRCTAADVAATTATDDGTALVAAATDEDVLVRADGGWTATGFGPAAAVGFDATEVGHAALVAVAPETDAVGRLLDPGGDDERWLSVADVDAPVRAVDGQFVAAADGCYRLNPDEITHVGLDDARDVAVVDPDGPWDGADALAATGDGLHRFDGGAWTRVLDGAFDAVAVAGDRAIAAGGDGGFLFDGDWQAVEFPRRPVAVGVGQDPYGVTAEGTFLAWEGDRWRTRSLGFPDVAGMCVLSG